jgi:hypothetical protein
MVIEVRDKCALHQVGVRYADMSSFPTRPSRKLKRSGVALFLTYD